jgi:hypothetical protein
MKRVLNAFWNFLEAWGEFRYQAAKKRGFSMYY